MLLRSWKCQDHPTNHKVEQEHWIDDQGFPVGWLAVCEKCGGGCEWNTYREIRVQISPKSSKDSVQERDSGLSDLTSVSSHYYWYICNSFIHSFVIFLCNFNFTLHCTFFMLHCRFNFFFQFHTFFKKVFFLLLTKTKP